jgi:diguanylate cyclase (GGDEF)-like protein
MTIDIPTILLMLVLVCGTVGAIFLSGWLKTRSELELRIAATMLPITVGGVLILMRGQVSPWLSIGAANALCLLGLGFSWSVARVFHRRNAPFAIVAAGAIVWLAANLLPGFYEATAYRVALMSLIAAAYASAAGVEFLRRDDDGALARHMIGILCFVHAGVAVARALYWLSGVGSADIFAGDMLQGLFLAEPVLAVIAFGIFGMALVRGRAEHVLRLSAETDALTGILNRHALFSRAERLLVDGRRIGQSVTLLLFDLDHFKSINDRFGHPIGDQTLCAFTRATSAVIRSNDVFGRVGGEEFAAVLVGANAVIGQVIAERIRLDFAAQTNIGGTSVPATVSVGVAEARPEVVTAFDTLLAQADAALYRAKRAGRDRVVSAVALIA